MKKPALVFIAALTFFISDAQSELIKKIFKLLPADKVYDLTGATRDSMLQGKTYYPGDNDSNEIAAYNYGMSTYVKDYLYVSLSFETEQRGTGMIEIRSFKKNNGDNLVLVSQTGGVENVAYSQHSLSVFVYSKDKKLRPYNKKILPAADETLFMKPEVPDSVKKVIQNNSNMTFDLSNEKITLGLNSNYVSGNKILVKWLKADVIYFDWIKDHFVISKTELSPAWDIP